MMHFLAVGRDEHSPGVKEIGGKHILRLGLLQAECQAVPRRGGVRRSARGPAPN
jgi:hypothetical protein